MIALELVREHLQRQANEMGFALFGVARAQPSPGYARLLEWISRGYAGTMSYIPKRLAAYETPGSVLEGCRSVVMLAMPYAAHPDTLRRKGLAKTAAPSESGPPCHLGSYASGQVDYHDLLRSRLNQLCLNLEGMVPGSLNRGVVDTAPLMERDFGQLAGLGWIGKNTLLLNRDVGSYFFLAALLTDVELSPDEPLLMDHCGTCTACLEACPTSAFVEPRVLNASRCISYLTIEYRGVIETELSDRMEDWIFGCDACQIVCPWNRKHDAIVEPPLLPDQLETKQSLQHWLSLDDDTFRTLYRKTPFWRTKLSGMQRNAMIAAANMNRQDLRPLIERFLRSDNQVLVETCRRCLTGLAQKSTLPIKIESAAQDI
jgi:epoxyqueuosine reductase